MKKVTVAIADTDPVRREKLEQSLQGEQDIKVITNVMSSLRRPANGDSNYVRILQKLKM